MGGDAVAHSHGWSGAMKAAHVVAIVGTALLLAHGEQAPRRLARWLLPAPPRLRPGFFASGGCYASHRCTHSAAHLDGTAMGA